MKTNHDQHACQCQFSNGDLVLICNFGQGSFWLPGVVSEVRGPVSYVMTLEDGRAMQCHVDLVRPHWTTRPKIAVLAAAPGEETDSLRLFGLVVTL